MLFAQNTRNHTKHKRKGHFSNHICLFPTISNITDEEQETEEFSIGIKFIYLEIF